MFGEMLLLDVLLFLLFNFLLQIPRYVNTVSISNIEILPEGNHCNKIPWERVF